MSQPSDKPLYGDHHHHHHKNNLNGEQQSQYDNDDDDDTQSLFYFSEQQKLTPMGPNDAILQKKEWFQLPSLSNNDQHNNNNDDTKSPPDEEEDDDTKSQHSWTEEPLDIEEMRRTAGAPQQPPSPQKQNEVVLDAALRSFGSKMEYKVANKLVPNVKDPQSIKEEKRRQQINEIIDDCYEVSSSVLKLMHCRPTLSNHWKSDLRELSSLIQKQNQYKLNGWYSTYVTNKMIDEFAGYNYLSAAINNSTVLASQYFNQFGQGWLQKDKDEPLQDNETICIMWDYVFSMRTFISPAMTKPRIKETFWKMMEHIHNATMCPIISANMFEILLQDLSQDYVDPQIITTFQGENLLSPKGLFFNL